MIHLLTSSVEAEVKSVSDLQDTENGTGWEAWLDVGGREYCFWFFHTINHNFFATSGMPYDKTAKDFDWTIYGVNTDLLKKTCNAFVTKYIDFRQDGRGLYIYSETMGSGKTLLACCLANEVIDRYHTKVKFITSAEYSELTRQFADVTEYRTCALLILDDIGSQSEKTDFQRETMFRLINERYNNNLSTIYTSNLPFGASSTDDRVLSRVYGSSVPIHLPEVPVRKNKADEYRKKFLNRIMVIKPEEMEKLK